MQARWTAVSSSYGVLFPCSLSSVSRCASDLLRTISTYTGTCHSKFIDAMDKTDPVPLSDKYGFDEASSPKEYVSKTYQGTAADRREMTMLGKKQVLKRTFGFMTMLGFASTVSKFEGHLLAALDLILTASFNNSGGLGVCSSGFAIWPCRWRHFGSLLGAST